MLTREDYERFFREADTDGSGELTFDELYNMLKKKGFRGSKSEIERHFAHCDTSGDKKLSMEEYLQAMGQVPPQQSKEAVMRSVFLAYDKSGDGYIDKKEVRGILQELRSNVTEEQADRALKLMDADGDGKVNYEEFIAYCFGQ